ncbi:MULTISPECIES: 30S ribosomal protein S6 [Crocosphaera]|uniref:Small ribosomal subunit protein bS6 n=2 Tax=Crocosphaera watsonii TaxID=263511 RepID=T2JT59_CROWT|nr:MULTISPECIES: 30S ribosomal protein S6 [Crocosphaera]MCH2244639.1 30S ribosomal protein S6 [Crocosphaera sp.]NQZ61057.1 30S ribosomal protein S6 [Crocosphaera sp.]CCQ50498.1 SSU ribosomal protein S6p [Crocosphaera watsonii WH 8502]CCQ68241.1 SSU ribosomal protein S6p [Crocosphaera watsonii WH 0402]
MSQSYEMIFILRPDLSEDQVNQALNSYKEFLTTNNATNLEVKIWGKRRLAYPIQKKVDGIYVQFNYEADGTQIAPLERMMRLGEEVMRYLTIRLDTVAPSSEAEEEEGAEAEPVASEA